MQMTSTMKAYKGMGMEGGVARWYERTTRKVMEEYRNLAARIAEILPPAATVLEIAPGPGFLSIEMARLGLQVRGIDISKTFVEIARRNAAEACVEPQFEQGNASALPVADESVQFVVCRSAFKNFTEPVKALMEMRRVLKPGGIALVLDLRQDVPIEEVKQYVEGLHVGWLDRRFQMFVFKKLIGRSYHLTEIRRMAAEAGWVEPRIEPLHMGYEAWMTK